MTIWYRIDIIFAGVRFSGPGNVNTIHLQKVFSRIDIIAIIITITINVIFLLTNEEASQSNHMAPPEEEDPHREISGN